MEVLEVMDTLIVEHLKFQIMEEVLVELIMEMLEVQEVVVGDELSAGGRVIGTLQKEVYEICPYADGSLGSATLIWSKDQWVRIGTVVPPTRLETPQIYRGLVVLPFSQIELHTGERIRDYIEIASPDIEEFYQEELSPLGQGDGGHTKSTTKSIRL